MDYWGCDADGMFRSNPISLSRSEDAILNWEGITQVPDGTNPVAITAEDRLTVSGVGGVLDGRSAGKFGSRLPQRAALPLMLNSSEPSGKRSRRGRMGGGANLQHASCQVYGCNKDLSTCKDYHKRHKVCEVHTKTAKVIVNGIEQRFCQQCSRFHLLAEFDDGKRSCRKRLAGHNARRRKACPSLHSIGGPRKMLFPRYGTEYPVDAHPSASFVRQDLLLSHNPISSEKIGKTNGFGILKQVPGLNCEAQSAIGFLPNFACHGFDELAFNSSRGFSAVDAHFGQRPNPVLQLLLWDDKTPLQSDGVSMLNSSSAWTDQGLPGIPKSTRVLSLLSPQSWTCSDHASGIQVDGSSVVHDSKSPCITRPPIMLNPQAVAEGLSGMFCSPTEGTRF